MSIWHAVIGLRLAIVSSVAIIVVGSILGLNLSVVIAMLIFTLAGTYIGALLFIPFLEYNRRTTLDRVRELNHFARDHGLRYEGQQRPPSVVTRVVGIHPRCYVYDSLNSTFPTEWSMGTYVRTAKPNGTGLVQDWGYLAIRLERELPNILLESRSSRSVFADTSLLGTPHTTQRLSLEGDFDKHFRLFCPGGYERDALYIFTPDLMGLLIDEAGDLSVQLIDDVAFFFSAKPFDLSNENTRSRLLRIVDVVGAKALRQTKSYRDERSEQSHAVAHRGQRLNRGLPRWLTLSLWHSAEVLVGLGITWLLFVLCLGLDPSQWTANSYTRW